MWTLTFCLAAFTAVIAADSVTPHGIPVVKTTTLPNGQVIDWVRRSSQGDIAAAPPFAPFNNTVDALRHITIYDSAASGPTGTVPILRATKYGNAMPKKQLPGDNTLSRRANHPHARDNYAGRHWYASTSQRIDNHGGSATFSRFKAYVQRSGDFSLLQTAVVRTNVPGAPGQKRQTVEAGWINFPQQISDPHLFTYFTTVSHTSDGDSIGGWNTNVQGWVQVDSQYHPGMVFPLSVVDGDQKDLQIRYLLREGNWWLGINDKWAGYYPASMFSRNGATSATSLEGKGDLLYYYGEIYQSETTLTTTDMGSGHFAQEGYKKAAYIKQITYTDAQENEGDYDGSQGTSVDDENRYSLSAQWKSGQDGWGSYFFLGGPGAGGVIGG
ncbi:hypothetical protein QQS21_008677 [Conoideocrella luteorostrata]|uniref:Neprosin PEP catalytic domain-containing protein n=1 Tax=Conoideocrella luteorostrata TaxID=1105319 RepID=A0AAJ0CL39_9HYPO|nr:hypothetical protein QQS21_008677 [Conoideocrella luteorostrata]